MIQLNHQTTAQLEITVNGTKQWADLGGAFKSITQSLNESIYTASYLADGGFSSSTVTGMGLTVTFSGDYVSGDPVIGFIFSESVLHGVGNARKTRLKLTRDGTAVTWGVTMTKIQEAGGEANDANSVTLELRGNGKPTVTAA